MNMEQMNGATKPLVGSGDEACRGGAMNVERAMSPEGSE